MSRKAKQQINLPKGVEVKLQSSSVTVKGPKGTLEHSFPKGIEVEVKDQAVIVSQASESKDLRPFLGLTHALIQNMVTGSFEGFSKKLEMIGVGYRASVQGQNLQLQVGYSHPVLLPIPEGLKVDIEKNTVITVSGADKQQVGQFSSKIRAKRPPEPYQGKGIRYQGEHVRKKAGKSAAKK